ncbi:hypothetical protein AgCh_034328 [Apium graveolens]
MARLQQTQRKRVGSVPRLPVDVVAAIAAEDRTDATKFDSQCFWLVTCDYFQGCVCTCDNKVYYIAFVRIFKGCFKLLSTPTHQGSKIWGLCQNSFLSKFIGYCNSVHTKVADADKTKDGEAEIVNEEEKQKEKTAEPRKTTIEHTLPEEYSFKEGELEDLETVALTEECSAVLQQKLPSKLKDPGSFTIPCTIGKLSFDKCLCDLGASINLMPLSIFKKLNLPDPKPTYMSLQLADRSITYPRGIVEDVLVKVDKLFFPADFVILDFEEDKKIPIILGRPFLATGRTLIDVQKGELTMRVQDQDVTFNVFKAKKFPTKDEECLKVDLIDSAVTSELDHMLMSDALEKALVGDFDSDDEDGNEQVQYLNASPWRRKLDMPFESLGTSDLKNAEGKLKPSIEEAPTLELKPLPEHLRYAFLGDASTLPVIIASDLSGSEEDKLLRILREFKSAIGWTIAHIKGISPSYCMHKIMLEEGSKPTVEQQRRLNPIMKEVVKKEILKWLDVGIIYPISESSWFSPVQCVPKKGGITVVANEKNELIHTRTVTGWRVCMDYRKLNKATRKDHFPLPFIDQMLDKLAGLEYYCLLDGYSGYNQICIAPEDQEKTTFTYPFGTFAFRRVSFGLCGAPATFQRCMMAIFSDMIGNNVEVFMDDFSVFGHSYDECLNNLRAVLKRCVENNLVLNWEKCHFMVREGIILGHKVSSKGLEVDKAKVGVIENLPPPVSVKRIRSFLGHAGFYRHFIKEFSKISKPLCNLLEKDVPFKFEMMCEASDYTVGAGLGQHKNNLFHVVYYASKTVNGAQMNYTTTEKELLAIVFGFKKFRSYLLGTKVTVFTNHAAIRYLVSKKDSKPRLIRWVLLLQEFELEIKDRKGTENQVADHLSRLENPDSTSHDKILINESFPDEQLFAVQEEEPWFADIVNYLVSNIMPPNMNTAQRKKFLHEDAHQFDLRCDHCQRVGNLTRKDEMPLNVMLEVEVFDVWGIDFMGPFVSSCNNQYILLAVDYVSKWVEVKALPTNDAKVVLNFLHKQIFTRFGTPRVIISDEGSHFYNRKFTSMMQHYNVNHRVATAYHPQTNCNNPNF